MALSKDREQRLTNRLSVLEKMLSNHGEMVQKNNDGIKSIESSLAASKEAVSRTDGKAMREERPRNTVSSLTTTTQQKTWADACKEETSDSESTQLSEAHGSKIKKRKRKLMPSSSTSKDIQHNASNVKQVHSSTGDPNRSRTVGGVRLRQELEIRQLSKYNLPKWESEASDDEPLWKLVTNRKPGPPKVDIYLGNLPEEMTKEKVTKYIQRRAQSAGESPPTIFRCTVQNAKPQNDGTIKTYARLTIKKTDRDLVLDRGFWPPSLHAREWKFNKPDDEGAALAAQKEDAAPGGPEAETSSK